MKSNHFCRILLAAALLGLAFTGCKPDDDPVNPGVNPATYDRTGVHTLMASIRPAPQSFTVTAGVNTSITGAKGTRITFYPNSFKDASGNVVSSGNVQISLTEMYSAGDKIANRATTTSGGNLLISGGQIYITATQGGQALTAGAYSVWFAQPARSGQPMRIFPGSRDATDSVLTWMEPVGSPSDGTRTDSTGGFANHYYMFDSVKSFSWINCDYFYNSSAAKTNIGIRCDTAFNPSNTNVYLAVPSVNGIMFAGGYARSGGQSTFTGYNLPVGIVFHAVLISKRGNNWYYAELKNQTAVQNHTLSLSPAQVTEAQLKLNLNGL